MKKPLICGLFLLFSAALFAEERLAGSLHEVDLYIDDLLNEQDHNHGEKYRVFNRSPHAMRVSIKLIEAKNAIDSLVPYTIIVNSKESADLGEVKQKTVSETSDWKYEWKAQRDCSKNP